jgi:hypothetical protein
MTVVKTLFALSQNHCAFSDPDTGRGCEHELTNPRWKKVRARICHIHGKEPNSARYDPMLPCEERNRFENLILLCPNHHSEIDDLEPERFAPEVLAEMKERALQRVEAHAKWADEDRLDDVVQQALAQMRVIWAVEEGASIATARNDASHTIDAEIIAGDPVLTVDRADDGDLNVTNRGGGDARQVRAQMVQGAPGRVELATIQGTTVAERQVLRVGFDREPLSKERLIIRLDWIAEDGTTRSRDFPLPVHFERQVVDHAGATDSTSR